MKYFGGKAKTGKEIAKILEAARKPDQPYLEPFCGSCNVVCEMSGDRTIHDFGIHLAKLWEEIIAGTFSYPIFQITAAQYKLYSSRKNQTVPDSILAFVGYGLSFGGKWFGGFNRDKDGKRNYQKETENGLKKKGKKLIGVKVSQADYQTLNPKGYLIYCDPPYANTTQYGAAGIFNSNQFWTIMQNWAKDNTVFVSEYSAPNLPNIVKVWSKEQKQSVRSKAGCAVTTENLYRVYPI